jgi:orotate phosphoribosyltransferase
MMAELARPLRTEVVCGPAMGGIILAQWTGHALGLPAVYAEKAPGGGMVLTRGYDAIVRSRQVLVVEDVLNTGGSLADTVRAVATAGGTVAGAVALCNRGGVTAAAVGVPVLHSLIEVTLDSWAAEACPLCERRVPINTDVGKGRAFLEKTGR